MSLVKRTELNRPLTHREVDSNFEYVDVAEWAPQVYLKGQKVYTLGNNGIYPIYICLVNHDETAYTTGSFNEYGLVNAVNTKLWLKTGADTFTGVITGVTVNATYQAYTGSTITGTTLNLKGHNIPDSHLNFVNAIRNTYKAYTGITTSGNNIVFDGHNTSPTSFTINLEPFINTNYKSITGITLSGAVLSHVGHNISPFQIDLEPVIKNNYKAITGITQITNNLLQFVGHNLPTVIFDIGTIIGLNYKSFTGATYNSLTNSLLLTGHNVAPATIDFTTGIRNAYKAYTGSSFSGNILTLVGHNVPTVPYDLSTILNGVSYVALTGVTLDTRGLKFPSHGQAIQTIDLSNPVGEIYRAITGATLVGTNLMLFGHNTPVSVINLAGIVTGGTSGTGKTESVYTRVMNLSGSLIAKGSPVIINSSQGGVPTIQLSVASQSPIAVVHGLVTNNIPNGSYGQIITHGLLTGLTLNPGYSIGDVLYLSDITPGGTTNNPAGLAITSRTIQIGTVMTNGGATGSTYVHIVSEDVEMPITANERKVVEGNLTSTGVYQYQNMVAVGGAAFDVLPLKGWVTLNVDGYSENPNVIYVNFPGATGVVSPFINSDDSTYVFVTTGSSVNLQATFPLPQERRNMIYLGRIDHSDRATVQYIDNTPDFVVSPFSTLRDVLSSVKLINVGVKPIAQVPNLNIGYTNGFMYGNGINWSFNRSNPNRVVINGVAAAQLKYATSVQANFSPTLNIDPTNYDPSGFGAISGVVSGATNQRIYMSPRGVVWIQYGQEVYPDLITAVLNIQREIYVEHNVNRDVNILIGAISVLASATDLTDRHQAIIHTATKTGDLISNLIGIGFATSLQQAYNNSTNPEIVTDPVLGAVSIRQGSGSDGDPVLEIHNGVNTTTASITGAGDATLNNVTTNTLSVLNPISDDNLTQVLGIDMSGLTYRTTLDNLIRNNYLAYTGSSMSGNILFLQGHNIPGESFDITNSITDTYKAFTGATITNSILSFISHNVAPLSLDLTNTVKANYRAFTGATLVGSVIHFSGHNGNQTLDLSALSITTLTGITLQTVMDNGNTTDHQMQFLGSTGQTRTQIDKGSMVLFSDSGSSTLDFYVSALGDDTRITYKNSNGFYTRLYALPPSSNRTLYYPNKNGTLAIEGDYKAFTGATLVGYFLHFSGHNINQTIDLTVLAGGITGLTPGSVLFGSPSGSLGENNTDFYWDDTLSRLSITNSGNPLNLNNPSAGLGMYVSLGQFDPNYMGIHSMSGDEGLAEFSVTNGQYYYAGRILRYNQGTDVLYYSGTTFSADAAIETINSHVFAAYDTNSGTWTNSTLLGYDGLNVRTPAYTSKFQGGLISTLDNVSGGTLNLIFDPLTGTKTQKYQNRTGTIALLGDYKAFTGATLVGSVIHFSGHNGNQTLDLSPIAAGTYFAYTGSTLSGNVFSLFGHNVSPATYDFTNVINNTYKAYTGGTYNSLTNSLLLTGHNVVPNTIDFATGIRNIYKSYTGATLFGAILTLSGHGIVNASLNFTNTIKANYKAFTGATLVGTVVYFSGHNVNQTLNLASLAGGGVSGLTPNAVLFGSPSGTIGQNVTKFNWDDTLGALRIIDPSFTTQITGGSLYFQDNATGGSLLVKLSTGSTANNQFFQKKDGTLALLGDFTAFTGATLVGNVIHFSGHSVNQSLDLTPILNNTYVAITGVTMTNNVLTFTTHGLGVINIDTTNSIKNTYKAYTGSSLSGNIFTLQGHSVPLGVYDFTNSITNTYSAITGVTVTNNILNFVGHNVPVIPIDITNSIVNTYKAYTGGTLSGNVLTLNGHIIPLGVFDFTNSINSTYKAYTGATYNSVTNSLLLNGHNIANANLSFATGIRNLYVSTTGGTITNNILTFIGHNQPVYNIDITNAISSTYKSYTGSSLSGSILTLNGHNISNDSYDFTNAIKSNYSAFTGATLVGNAIKFSGHSVNQTLDLTSLIGAMSYVAYTGGTLSGNILTLIGHGISNGVFDFTTSIRNTYKAFTGATINLFNTGATLNLLGHGISNLSLNFRDVHTTGTTTSGNIISFKNSQNIDNFTLDITNPITSTYKAYTGATITNNILTFVGHGISNATIDITNAIRSSYSAFTGVTTSGNILQFSGHTISNKSIDLSNIIRNVYVAYTGSSLSGAILSLIGHGVSTANYDFTTAIRNIYSSTTGGTITNNIMTFVGHNLSNYTIDITNAITNTYKAYSGSSLSGAILTLNGHGVSNANIDFTNTIKANYKAFTGATLVGNAIKFSGHSVNLTLDLSSIIKQPTYYNFNNGLTMNLGMPNYISNDLITGRVGGQTIIGGNQSLDMLSFMASTQVTSFPSNIFYRFLGGTNNTSSLVTISGGGDVVTIGNFSGVNLSLNGSIQSASTATNGNLYVVSNIGGSSLGGNSVYQLSPINNQTFRTLFYGSNNMSNPGSQADGSNVLFAGANQVIPSSGGSPVNCNIVSNVAIVTPNITTSGGYAANAASLYIKGNPLQSSSIGQTAAIIIGGNNSGYVGIKTNDDAGTWTLTLPTTSGLDNQFLTTDGYGNTWWSYPLNLRQVGNTWLKAQIGVFTKATYGATTTLDLSSSNNFKLILTGNTTMGVPTNINAGQSGIINVRQDITGSRTMAYAWVFEFVGGTAPVLSTGKLVLDQLVYMVNNYATSTVTISNASPGVVTWTNHGLNSGDKIQLTTTGGLPTGLSTATTYWITKINDNTFKLSSSLANAQAATFINTSSAGSGVHTAINASITLTANLSIS